MSKGFEEAQAWVELLDRTEDENVQLQIKDYIDLIMDNKIDIKSSKHERAKMSQALEEIRRHINRL